MNAIENGAYDRFRTIYDVINKTYQNTAAVILNWRRYEYTTVLLSSHRQRTQHIEPFNRLPFKASNDNQAANWSDEYGRPYLVQIDTNISWTLIGNYLLPSTWGLILTSCIENVQFFYEVDVRAAARRPKLAGGKGGDWGGKFTEIFISLH